MQLVLDTNIVLDLLVFADPQARPLQEGLAGGALQWLATPPMREELARVLAYPKLAPRVDFHRGGAQAVLDDFDRHARVLEVPATMRSRSTGSTKKGGNLAYGVRYARVMLGTWWREGCPRPVAECAPALQGSTRDVPDAADVPA